MKEERRCSQSYKMEHALVTAFELSRVLHEVHNMKNRRNIKTENNDKRDDRKPKGDVYAKGTI